MIPLLLCLLLLIGCGGSGQQTVTEAPTAAPTEAPTPEPTEEPSPFSEAYLMLSEPEAFGRLVNSNALTAERDGVIYWLSTKQTEPVALMNACAAQCETLAALGYDTAGLTVYILPNGSDYSDSAAKAAHLNPDTVGQAEAFRVLLGAILGDYTNAGYLYALSQKIAGAEADASPDADVFLRTPELLNLVSPCFTERYVDGSALAACRALAMRLLNEMDDPYAGEEAFLQRRDVYAEAIGADFTPTAVRYTYNSETCPVRAQTYDMEIFLSSDYPEMTFEKIPDLHFDPLFAADTMIRFFDALDAQSRELSALFKMEKGEYLPVRLTNSYDDGGQTGGWFVTNWHQPKIIARTYSALRHEYVHYLYYRAIGEDEEMNVRWCNESLAYWYGRIEDFETRRLYMENKPENAQVYLELLGKPFKTPEDYVTFCRLVAKWTLDSEGRNGLRYELKKYIGGNIGKVSFGDYFIQTYGEQAFIDCIIDPSLSESVCGKPIDSVVEDWMDWLPPLTDEQRELLSD